MKSITIAFRKQKEKEKVAFGTAVSLGSMSFEASRLSFGAALPGGRPSPTGRESGQMEEVDVLFRCVKGGVG